MALDFIRIKRMVIIQTRSKQMTTTGLKSIASGQAMALGASAFERDANMTIDAISAKLSAVYDALTVAYVAQGYMEAKRGFIGHAADHFSNFIEA